MPVAMTKRPIRNALLLVIAFALGITSKPLGFAIETSDHQHDTDTATRAVHDDDSSNTEHAHEHRHGPGEPLHSHEHQHPPSTSFDSQVAFFSARCRVDYKTTSSKFQSVERVFSSQWVLLGIFRPPIV